MFPYRNITFHLCADRTLISDHKKLQILYSYFSFDKERKREKERKKRKKEK